MLRKPATPKRLGEWRITLVRKNGQYLGRVEAADAESAIKQAVEEFQVDPAHWSRLIAQPIDLIGAVRSVFGEQRTSSGHQRRTAPNVWSGRALQEGFVDLADAVLHQCIRSFIGARRGSRPIMDISARASSLADRLRKSRPGHQGWACAGKTDPPSPLILSQTSAGWYVIDRCSLMSFLCSHLATVPSSRPARPGAPRARDRQGWPSRRPCILLLRFQATP